MRPTTTRRRCRGFTLIEVVISTVVLAILLQAILQGALAMAGSTEFGQKRQRLVVSLNRALDKIQAELEQTSTDVDVNGVPYITVGGIALDATITFKRIVGFGSNGAEVEPPARRIAAADAAMRGNTY